MRWVGMREPPRQSRPPPPSTLQPCPAADTLHQAGTRLTSGGCPHAAIREDISANMHALEELQAEFDTELLFVESGGDNLAANYSRELADYIIYVVRSSLVSGWPTARSAYSED